METFDNISVEEIFNEDYIQWLEELEIEFVNDMLLEMSGENNKY